MEDVGTDGAATRLTHLMAAFEGLRTGSAGMGDGVTPFADVAVSGVVIAEPGSGAAEADMAGLDLGDPAQRLVAMIQLRLMLTGDAEARVDGDGRSRDSSINGETIRSSGSIFDCPVGH